MASKPWLVTVERISTTSFVMMAEDRDEAVKLGTALGLEMAADGDWMSVQDDVLVSWLPSREADGAEVFTADDVPA